MGKCEIGFKKTNLYKGATGSDKYGSGLSGNTLWFADILETKGSRYLVKPTRSKTGAIGSNVFSPTQFWVDIKDCRNVSFPSTNKPGEALELKNGDILRLTDEKGKHVGDLVFKKK